MGSLYDYTLERLELVLSNLLSLLAETIDKVASMPNWILETERLYLRQWVEDDFARFAKMSADPRVMKYFPKLLSVEQSNQIAAKCQQLIADRGWGFWAVGLKKSHEAGRFIGFVGLHEPQADLPFAPCIEVGWRLHPNYWGQGYATEAGRAALEFAFEVLNANEVVSFTAAINQPSRLVMERLGMTNTQSDFEHPAIPESDPPHPLARHVLYKITRREWTASNGS